jgi:hypothetical protein
MTTNGLKTLVAVAAAALLVPASSNATTLSGRVTSFSPTSITVMDKEIVTVRIDADTVFTKLIAQKPWQEDATLTAKALRVGGFVVVHVPTNNGFLATWVQVALDRGFANVEPVAAIRPTTGYLYTDEALKHHMDAMARRANPTASESKRPGAVDTAAHCERLAALGRTEIVAPSVTSAPPANSEAAAHRAEAAARRAAPTASESKRPGSVDTAAHCDRRADELEKAGK